MQLPFFFEEELPEDQSDFSLSPETSKHVAQVLRMKPGEELILTNGKGIELTAKVILPDKRGTSVAFVSRRNLLAPDQENGIAVSLLKNESRFEWFIEKATELGIRHIYPLITARTEKKSLRINRIRTIMISAMLQSRQYFLPELSDPVNLESIFELRDYQQKMIAHCMEDSDKLDLKDVVDKQLSGIILIGPEGDFTDDEIAECKNKAFIPISLGENRLRTETAAIKAAIYLVG